MSRAWPENSPTVTSQTGGPPPVAPRGRLGQRLGTLCRGACVIVKGCQSLPTGWGLTPATEAGTCAPPWGLQETCGAGWRPSLPALLGPSHGAPLCAAGRVSWCLLPAPLMFQAPLRARLPGGGPGGRLLGPPPAVPELRGSAARPALHLSQPSLAPTAATAVGPSPKRGLPGREPPTASESEPGCGR